MWFGGKNVNGHVQDEWRWARAMPPPPFQVRHSSRTEILLRVDTDNLNKALVCVFVCVGGRIPSGENVGS